MIQKKMLQITNGVTIFLKEHSYVFQISIYTKKSIFQLLSKFYLYLVQTPIEKKYINALSKKIWTNCVTTQERRNHLGQLGFLRQLFYLLSFWDFFLLNREQRSFLEKVLYNQISLASAALATGCLILKRAFWIGSEG